MTEVSTHAALLARNYGTPLYLYDLDIVQTQARTLRQSVTYPTCRFLYAMKANYNRAILETLKAEGFGIDAVSPAEIHLALKLGYSPGEILYTANNSTREELREVSSLGVLCNIDSLSNLRVFAEISPGAPVCLRVNPEITAGSHKAVQTAGVHVKFGLLPEHLPEALSIAHAARIAIVGLHEHTGSGILDFADYIEGAQKLLALITPEKFPELRFVDFGGGLGIPFRPAESKLDVGRLGSALSRTFGSFCERFGKALELWIEPGKFLVGECGSLLVQVTSVRENRGKLIAGTNSGFNHLIRPVLYGAYHEILNISNPSGEVRTYDVVGNVCESGDYFAEARALPELREGDLLKIRNAGAYGASMASLYNLRPLPAEVAVRGGEIVRGVPRQSYHALSEQYFVAS